jgi:peptidylprolyl isomerase
VQDNYVVQWGDANGEDKAKAKKLPPGLDQVSQVQYATAFTPPRESRRRTRHRDQQKPSVILSRMKMSGDAYAPLTGHWHGWQFASFEARVWPVHCYGMVGVGRDMSPDTGTGAELYTVIGHAPRHLDRNIALVGRVISGIENLSSLPRGTGDLGFYKTPAERTGITSIRIGSDVASLPRYEFLSTESASFAAYADARANRRDAFFIQPAGGADICNIPVPVRAVK